MREIRGNKLLLRTKYYTVIKCFIQTIVLLWLLSLYQARCNAALIRHSIGGNCQLEFAYKRRPILGTAERFSVRAYFIFVIKTFIIHKGESKVL